MSISYADREKRERKKGRRDIEREGERERGDRDRESARRGE